jgi:hypothetical protein
MGSKGSAHKDHFTQKKRYPLPSFHVVGKESGVSIFATQYGDAAVRFDKSAPLAKAEAVDGVEGAFLIRGVLSSSECEQFMQLTEAMGFDEALVSTGHGMVKMTGLRNNKVCPCLWMFLGRSPTYFNAKISIILFYRNSWG